MALPHGEHSVSVDGVALAYTVAGSGPPLFAVSSGWGVGSGYLMRGLAPLADRFTLVCIATRGSGRSSRPADETAMSSATMADDIDGLRRHLGLEAIDLFGHSNGGAIALSYAARHPAACRKLVLSDSQLIGFPGSEATRAILSKRAGDPRYAQAVRNFATSPMFDDAGFTAWLFSIFPLYFHDPERNMQAMIDTFDLPVAAWAAQKQWAADALPVARQVDEPSRVTADTLILVGRDDFITPLPVAERIRDGIARSRLIVIEQCGHIPWIEQPALFFGSVAGFVANG